MSKPRKDPAAVSLGHKGGVLLHHTRKTKVRIHRRRAWHKRTSELGEWLLEISEEILSRSALLDTAVRDEISTGLAYLVRAANDCALASLPDYPANFTIARLNWVDGQTATWFRDHGFAEWFCLGAASGFNVSHMPVRLKAVSVK